MMPDDSVRAALEAAMTTAQVPEPSAPPEPDPTPSAPAAVAATPDAPAPAADRARGPDGKFVKAEPAEQPAAPAAKPDPAIKPAGPLPGAPAVGAAPPAPPAEPVLKAPQAWKPAAREAFAKAPPEVQAEVARREREMAVGLQEAAEAKRVASAYGDALKPYGAVLGPEPHKTVAGLAQTVHALQSAPEHVVVDMLARIVKGYGARFGPGFIEKFAAGYDGQPATAAPYTPPVDVAGEVKRVLAEQTQQNQRAQIAAEIRDFEAESPEFYSDVKQHMAGLLQGGLAKDLKDAYEKACSLHPEISAVLKQREAAEAAKTAQVSTQQRRNAASSIKSEPNGTHGPAPDEGWRGALEKAWSGSR